MSAKWYLNKCIDLIAEMWIDLLSKLEGSCHTILGFHTGTSSKWTIIIYIPGLHYFCAFSRVPLCEWQAIVISLAQIKPQNPKGKGIKWLRGLKEKRMKETDRKRCKMRIYMYVGDHFEWLHGHMLETV